MTELSIYFGLNWMEYALRDFFVAVLVFAGVVGALVAAAITTTEYVDRRRFAARASRKRSVIRK